MYFREAGQPIPAAGAAAIKPHINKDEAMKLLTGLAKVLKLSVCLVDHINYRGEKLNGLYNGANRRIYLDKHLKGYKLRFVLMHEIAHYVLHTGKLGPRYWKDPTYRQQLEKEADDYAMSILNILERRQPFRSEVKEMA
ncbi:MAG: hypothetical protein A4E52_00444 [Pelotomaculum sp. PtaB.Bin013]|uniref:ImmA/IrrE family metallo-endopeptidase n=1 Tax=Pelotomaculum isophthalicicum JI TaxID=947010 RepID=A0A9X4JW07_9FIRM|nr:ImmA/IrrE family metallo-endopeptidase [Pelotomaculum isophthalicicum]MDF9408278.1 ImmA/IrrE family metallo-endopeptidase [Pelotomaculum isophthalicicum JI]OPX91625.1 MAG: hypothetical protein A4E52_00444 [Pelotomaculum sp. PtaB.Bin013]